MVSSAPCEEKFVRHVAHLAFRGVDGEDLESIRYALEWTMHPDHLVFLAQILVNPSDGH